MGFGLILAGLGKGIADAGTTYGGTMMRAAESEMAEDRAMRKAEALERLKLQMAEETAQREATKAVEIEKRAEQMGQQRTASQLQSEAARLTQNAQSMAGDSPALTPDEYEAHLYGLTPEQRNTIAQTGLVNRSLSRAEQLMQGADDQVQAARELGASSNLLRSYQDAKRSVLDQIRLENAERREENIENDRRAQREIDRRRADIAERNADTNARRVERMGAGGGGRAAPERPATTADMQRQIDSAEDSIARRLGTTKRDLNAAIRRVQDRAARGDARAQEQLSGIQPYLDEVEELGSLMRQYKRPAREATPQKPAQKASASGDNSTAPRRGVWNPSTGKIEWK